MEVRARAHWGHFSSPGRVDRQRKEKWTALISSKCPLYKYEYVPTVLLMELFVICHSLWRLVRSGKIIWVKGRRYGLPFNLGIQREDQREWTRLALKELLHSIHCTSKLQLQLDLRGLLLFCPPFRCISASESWRTVRNDSTQRSHRKRSQMH